MAAERMVHDSNSGHPIHQQYPPHRQQEHPSSVSNASTVSRNNTSRNTSNNNGNISRNRTPSHTDFAAKWTKVRVRRSQQLVALPVGRLAEIVAEHPSISAELENEGEITNNKPDADCRDKTVLVPYIVDRLLQSHFATAANATIENSIRETCLKRLIKLFLTIDVYTAQQVAERLQENQEEEDHLRRLHEQEEGEEQEDRVRALSVAQQETSPEETRPSADSSLQQQNNSHQTHSNTADHSHIQATSGDDVTEQHNRNIGAMGALTSKPQSATTATPTKQDSAVGLDPASAAASAAAPAAKSPERPVISLVPVTPLPITPSPSPYQDADAIPFVSEMMHRLALDVSSVLRSGIHPSVTMSRGMVTLETMEESSATSAMVALVSRPSCFVCFKSDAELSSNLVEHNSQVRDFHARLKRWDPFWKSRHDMVDFCTKNMSYKANGPLLKVRTPPKEDNPFRLPLVTTQQIMHVQLSGPGLLEEEAKPRQCCAIEFRLPSYVAKEVAEARGGWGADLSKLESGDLRLICRMLPLDSKAKKDYLADTHLWPKGTFLQVGQGGCGAATSNSNPISLMQRRQQSHDHALWKGNSRYLDLTCLINRPEMLHHLKLVTREDAKYALQLSVAEYQSPEAVFEETLRTIELINYDEAKKRAKDYVNDQSISLDDSDDEGQDSNKNPGKGAHLTFKLTCPISMTPMDIPVRGKNCRHLQCFELKNFIESNSFPSGRRWKCPCCDDFVALDSLIVCGLFRQMVAQYKKIVEDEGKDVVRIYQDGSWDLDEGGAKKRKADLALEQQQQQQNKKQKDVVEEIVILD